MRVALFTEIISPYRIPVFNALAKYPDIDLKVFFCSETEQKRDWLVSLDKIDFEYQVMPRMVHRFQHPHGQSEAYFNPSVINSLHKFKPDAIITGGYHQPTYWLVITYAHLFKKRLILWSESSNRDLRSNNRVKEVYKQMLVGSYRKYVVPGTPQKRYLIYLGVDENDIGFAPNAVDVDFFSRESFAIRERKEEIKCELNIHGSILLFVGRLTESKGIQDLLEAFATIQHKSQPTLIIVGSGPEKDRCQSIAQNRGISALFVGFKQQHELPLYYGISDIFVFPSHADPWGLVINEAMACGLPIIASSAAGATEDLVTHGWNGYTHQPQNIQQIKEAIINLLDNPELTKLMGENSRLKSKNFTPSHCAEGLALAAVKCSSS